MTDMRYVTWLATCRRCCWPLACSGISLQRGSREWSAHSSAMGFPHRYLVGKYGPSGPLALSSGSFRFGPDCVAKLFAAFRKSNYRIRLNGGLNRCCAPFARRSLSAAARVALSRSARANQRDHRRPSPTFEYIAPVRSTVSAGGPWVALVCYRRTVRGKKGRDRGD